MNREEAAHIVDVAFSVPQAVRRIGEDKTYHEDEIREAKRMAIKALEQIPNLKEAYNKGYKDGQEALAYHLELCEEEAEPCDCISRQATVERLCKVAEFMNEKRNGLGSPYIMAALFIQDNKDEFPPITPKPKTGHWIGDKCSECENERAWYGCNPKYCPDCGAKMLPPDSEKE